MRVVAELLGNGPFEGQKLQPTCVEVTAVECPWGIGNNSHDTLVLLVWHCSQPILACISVDNEWFCTIWVGHSRWARKVSNQILKGYLLFMSPANRCFGAQLSFLPRGGHQVIDQFSSFDKVLFIPPVVAQHPRRLPALPNSLWLWLSQLLNSLHTPRVYPAAITVWTSCICAVTISPHAVAASSALLWDGMMNAVAGLFPLLTNPWWYALPWWNTLNQEFPPRLSKVSGTLGIGWRSLLSCCWTLCCLCTVVVNRPSCERKQQERNMVIWIQWWSSGLTGPQCTALPQGIVVWVLMCTSEQADCPADQFPSPNQECNQCLHHRRE